MHEIGLTTLSDSVVTVPVEDRMYVDGGFVDGGGEFATEHPATHEVLAEVPVATAEQVGSAVAAAQRASRTWRTLDAFERRNRLERLADRIEDAAEDLTNLDVADNGSSIAEFRHDVHKGLRSLRYFAGLATELKGEQIPTPGETLDYTIREPYGVVAAVLPFNHPNMFVLQKLGPALAAGNGVVLKPSEYTPLSALYLARLVDELDVFPDGLVNVVTGAGQVGSMLVEHPGVDLVTMVGSVATGRRVMKGAAEHLAPVLLELGGKNPAIVFPDADVERAAAGAVSGMNLAWQGQSCGSGSRLLVHADVYDEVVERVVDGFRSVGEHVGDPFDPETEMGTLVSSDQFEKVAQYISVAGDEGATVLTGGAPIDAHGSGYFYEPTVIAAEPDMTVAREEIFGPVLSVLRWEEYERVVDVANDVEYGLTASVWTDDLRTAHRTVEQLEAGYVWVNQHGPHFQGTPFGGFGRSGIGNNEGLDELLAHTRVKNVNLDLSGELRY